MVEDMIWPLITFGLLTIYYEVPLLSQFLSTELYGAFFVDSKDKVSTLKKTYQSYCPNKVFNSLINTGGFVASFM